MDLIRTVRLLPTLPMLEESLSQAGWECQMTLADAAQGYRGIRLYHGQQQLHKDVLYLLRPEEKEFPFDSYTYISSVSHGGKANHLICPDRPDEEIMDQLLEVLSQFQSWQEAIDLLVYKNADLQELCELGARLLENPVCIHDDWFVMMAITAEYAEIMELEYMMSTAKGFVPRAVVEDFQYDSDFLETYAHYGAQIWSQPEKNQHSLYVNLWDGPVYKGRLLVARKNRDFLLRDYLLAEVLTQRALALLRRKRLGDEDGHRNMDDIIFAVLQGKRPEQAELNDLLEMLNWQFTDRFLCLRTRPQQSGKESAMDHLIHSDLFRTFPGSYILLDGQEQCVIVNLSRNPITQVSHLLAPLCRDYGLYAGISSPVNGINDIQSAYHQAGAALDQAFRLRSEKWILSFSDCALDHVLRNLPAPLRPEHLVVPELWELIRFDQEHGTQYFATLRAYLLLERDIPKTSETLIIHRTTLQYRLKKIQSMLRIDLDDPWRRLQLQLSLWILQEQGLAVPGQAI